MFDLESIGDPSVFKLICSVTYSLDEDVDDPDVDDPRPDL